MSYPLKLSELTGRTEGELKGSDLSFQQLSTDSRNVSPGDLFLALRGENFDGQQFCQQAIQNGAVGLVVEEHQPFDIPQLVVPCTHHALGVIAKYNRQQYQGSLIAVTGSNGKTTTKELVASILATKGPTLATHGNLNNDIGVPLTLLRFDGTQRYSVIEMGANAPGEIAYSTGLAIPDVAVITNAMAAHLEGFGSLVGVVKAKGEIFQGLSRSGIAVINADDQHAADWLELNCERKVMTFSLSSNQADIYASNLTPLSTGCYQFDLHYLDQTCGVTLPLLAIHNVANALAAAAATLAIGATLEEVVQGLETVKPIAGRLNTSIGSQGATIIDDSYNGNPDSVKAGIDLLVQLEGTKVLALGDMAELGPNERALHTDIGRYAAEQGLDNVLSCGPLGELAAQEFSRITGAEVGAFATKEQLITHLEKMINVSTNVLIKGSLSAGMKQVVMALTAKEMN